MTDNLIDLADLNRPRRSRVEPACSTPCAACPWRKVNHGRRHPGGWYTQRNRDRLWAGMRRGHQMSCHPTDPENPIPEGQREVPADVVTRECAGVLVLIQRELDIIDRLARMLPDGQDLARGYRLRRPRGLTLEGISENIHRVMFSRAVGEGLPRFGVLQMTPQVLDSEVGHDPLPWPFDVRLAF